MSSKQVRSYSPSQPASPGKTDAKKSSPPAKNPVSPPKGKAPEPVKPKAPEPPKAKAPEPVKPKAPEPAKPAKSTPAPKVPEVAKKGAFDAKAYAKNGVSE